MLLIISDLRWLTLFCVIYRTHIYRSCLHKRLLATLLPIINKMKEKKNKKEIWNIFANIYQEF